MKAFFCWVLCAVLLFGGCASAGGDATACFRGGFRCTVTGECNGVCFSARYEVAPMPADGVMPLTVIFYASGVPEGAWLRRDEAGAVTLGAGELEAALGKGAFPLLLDAFSDFGEIRRVTVSKEGQTVLDCDRATVTFASDGTPLSVVRAGITLHSAEWATGNSA